MIKERRKEPLSFENSLLIDRKTYKYINYIRVKNKRNSFLSVGLIHFFVILLTYHSESRNKLHYVGSFETPF